ncbi:transposase (plasmid) [Nostoc sp. UHCC 0926]|uniref:transposase n=1 Tax=Nostoc sp. UHCC 0926 TaxID=3025190 RepID=UPI00235DCDEF|nr:transposase [Nostoc sp. UHCC 0926]WDD36166.1 transposase [Nostoc sp. UHCC 0926]WDD36472.1 transposase [Nostoc sp. UHCC 0926]WDD36550.1 transposase [Nostoc sp. UHCC 0926]WDD36575.1 transposase [Nostoc sp. UHCC 0926]WDD36717.1 transposase [Nostoc sp. UHCC 0926]
MVSILAHAQNLVYTLLSLMPSTYQQENLEAMLGLFLQSEGYPLPEHSKSKSASALSRFLNIYNWSTISVIRTTRNRVIKEILSQRTLGRKPFLQVIIDLTTLEKFGKFKGFENLIRVYNGKRGLHLVVVYLVVGRWRVPWSFRVWKGKGTPSPAQLGLKMVKCLPKKLTKHFQVMVLVDTAFGSVEFIHGVRKRKYHIIAGIACTRKLIDGRCVAQLHKRGQQLRLRGLKFPVYVSWYYFKRDDGKYVKRFVISTKALKASTISWWGKRRWRIEGWFKTAKHRFGLHRFGQGTLLGVYRCLVLSLISYILAHWAYLSTAIASTNLPDWGQAAEIAFQTIFPQLVVLLLLQDIERLRELALSQGIDIQISRCKI